MCKIFVHDFYFEDSNIENKEGETDFCCSLNVYYNFSAEDPGDGWDALEYFNITVATPFGLAKFLDKCIRKGIFSNTFFYPHLLIVDKYDKEQIIGFIRNELQSLNGKSERELILKAIRKFDWENENIPEIYNRIFV